MNSAARDLSRPFLSVFLPIGGPRGPCPAKLFVSQKISRPQTIYFKIFFCRFLVNSMKFVLIPSAGTFRLRLPKWPHFYNN